jgi:electron transfer flavoprotein alpha subunit
MEKILLLLHTDETGGLPKAALEAVDTARGMACGLKESTWTVGLVGQDVQSVANSLAACGAGRFLGVSGDAFAVSRYATDAAAAEAICKGSEATVVLSPATSRWMRALPGVCQRLGGVVDSHVVGVGVEEGVVAVKRWYYRQRIEVEQARGARPWFVLMDPGASQPWSGEAGEVAVEMIPVDAPDSLKRTEVVGVEAPAEDEQTIRPDAATLFVAGAGWTKKQADGDVHTTEASGLILDFVRKTKCSLGSSKSLVDLSGEGQAVLPFLTHLHQVGQTGSTPRHAKGLATCCHGEEPHVVGWRFVNDRRAINTDPNCGWAHGKADVLYVADAFAVMREMAKLLG